MKSEVLINDIIAPALKHLAHAKPGIDSKGAKQFMLAVAAQESHVGVYFRQIKGPAQGIWQVEPATEQDVYENYLGYQTELADWVAKLLPQIMLKNPLVSCPLYCCGIARLVVYRQPDAMPEFGDRDGMWELYKKYYNSYLGAATQEEWNHNWESYVEGLDF